MASVHCLKHVKNLASTYLTNDDTVRAHAKRVAYEITLRHLAFALDIRGSRFQPEHVDLLKLQLGRIFDRDNPLLVRDVT